MAAGTTYYVYNPGYPNAYSGQRSCRWYAKSATRVRLSCEVFSLPATANCVGDRLSVSPSGDLQLSDAHRYCGTGTFAVESTGNYLNIVLESVSASSTGRFLCKLESISSSEPNCNCGWKKQTRIVGGTQTGVNEYPMMAGLIDSTQRILYCGATIISVKHVITAAHCVVGKSAGQLGVLVGDHDISTGSDTNASSLHRVSSFTVHPQYNADTQANDIGIVTVIDTIVFTLEVGPACLPFQQASNSFANSNVQVLGWGTTEFAGATSNTLQEVTLGVTPLASCQRPYPQVTNNQMCTYANGKDTCQFDSGGPVLWQNPSSRRLVCAGIISFGGVCASDTPGVNTRVGAYMNWILSVTPGINYCRLE
ncbi:venom serine protease 34 isoform X2 [Cephus cinctus]|nr:venom serine protease 34 isoform X2 [Cephus cinctus]